MLNKFLGAAVAVTMSTAAFAADFKPAVIYDMGGKFDKSFNEGVWNGVQKFTAESGVEVMEFEVTNETQREQAMRRIAERGATVILGFGFAQADAISKVAAEYPDRQFSIIDVGWLDAPNLRQYVFKEHEGSYIVGVAAAKASQTNKVGCRVLALTAVVAVLVRIDLEFDVVRVIARRLFTDLAQIGVNLGIIAALLRDGTPHKPFLYSTGHPPELVVGEHVPRDAQTVDLIATATLKSSAVHQVARKVVHRDLKVSKLKCWL